MTLRPRDLPRMRDQTIKHLSDPESSARGNTGRTQDETARTVQDLDVLVASLRVAELFWVAPDMATLAVSAGTQLAAANWATADRPSPCGLIVFDGGIGSIDAPPVSLPVDALSWNPHRGACAVWLWLARWRLRDEAAELGIPFNLEKTPPLIPISYWPLPVSTEPVAFSDLPANPWEPTAPTPTTILAALAASWLLMQQPQLVDRSEVASDKATRARYQRLGRSDPQVTLVDLRRQFVPQHKETEPARARHRHRWVVSGHWRDQPYGRERALRRKTWIAAYVKGPDGAPLLATERVNVWRR